MRATNRWMVVGAGALALAMTGCSADGGPEDASGTDETATQSITLGIAGVPPIFLESVAYVAEEEGYFEEFGLDVELRTFATSVDVGRAVTSGEIPAGMVGTSLALSMRASGSPTVALMGFEASSYLIGSADPSVTDCESLKGKTIAVDAAGAPKALGLTTMLASCGLTAADVSAVAVGGTQSADAMLAGQVDVAVMHPDELAVVQEERDTDVVMRVTDADPLSHFFSLVANEQAVADDKEALEGIVAGLRKAIEFVADEGNADTVADIAAEVTGRTPEVAKSALSGYLEIGYWPTDSEGLTEERIDHVLQQQIDAGNIEESKAPAYEDFVDLSIYEGATERLDQQ
jgi:NitT/TauT family transport system substrate-binding protein